MENTFQINDTVTIIGKDVNFKIVAFISDTVVSILDETHSTNIIIDTSLIQAQSDKKTKPEPQDLRKMF